MNFADRMIEINKKAIKKFKEKPHSKQWQEEQKKFIVAEMRPKVLEAFAEKAEAGELRFGIVIPAECYLIDAKEIKMQFAENILRQLINEALSEDGIGVIEVSLSEEEAKLKAKVCFV